VDDAELIGLRARHRDGGDGQVGLAGVVRRLHLIDGELVDVVAAEHRDVGGAGVADQV
jgi:hypothetical protein